MSAELGLIFLVMAFVFCLNFLIQSAYFLSEITYDIEKRLDIYLMIASACISLSFLCLVYCFITDDFSVRYVAEHSSVLLPWFYKACAAWGGHEGSMLLWVLILQGWIMGVAYSTHHLDKGFRLRVLMILIMVSLGFLLFILIASNPFLHQMPLFPIPAKDLNPLLQDIGFLFHPPMLYMGYVGSSVCFAFGVAGLWLGEAKCSWAKWVKPWTLMAWCCLTLGITLGSWWAYRELGWGGWWFWDPVENASFMPWLTLTALIHALTIEEKVKKIPVWTIFLCITAFSLSLIGTFLVRSGILVSVHAFAVDQTRGLFILILLAIVLGSTWSLFAFRSNKMSQTQKFVLLSKESALFLNSILLFIAMLTVLLGTLYPLLIDALGLGKLSVGAPYFNQVMIPLMLPVFILMGIGIHFRWHEDQWGRFRQPCLWMALFSIGLPLIYLQDKVKNMLTISIGLMVSVWMIIGLIMMIKYKLKKSNSIKKIHSAFWGMVLAHLGVAITIIGIAVSSGFGIQQDIKMAPGDEVRLAGHTIRFVSESSLTGANYHGTKACFQIEKGERKSIIFPEKRIYDIGKMVMTDSAIDVNAFRDIYLALGEPIGKEAWSVRLYYKPCIRWIWAGGILLFLGGLFSLTDRRYYR